jgi:hypothetical protein
VNDLSNLRVLENGGVKVRRLLGFVIEPQERRDLLRDSSCHILILEIVHFRAARVSRRLVLIDRILI